MICWADSTLSISYVKMQVNISIVTFKRVDCTWVAQSAIAWIHLVGPVTMPTANHARFSGNVW